MIDKYIEQLSSGKDETRKNASKKLINMGNRVIGELLDVLSTGNENAKWEAAFILGEIKDARAVDGLIKALANNSGVVKNRIIDSLGEINDPKVFNGLIEALNVSETTSRAADVLGHLGDQRAIPYLLKALETAMENENYTDYLKRYWISLALINLKNTDHEVRESLKSIASKDFGAPHHHTWPGFRADSLKYLQRIGFVEEQLFESLLDNLSPSIRFWASKGLVDIGKVTPKIIGALKELSEMKNLIEVNELKELLEKVKK